jgi:uncharacterized protein YaaR (DUF327 family)
MKTLQEETKQWFEANYLDGDVVQDGQILSSEECLKALLAYEEKVRERAREIAYKAFHEGVSAGMDEYRTSCGGKRWEETKTYKSLTLPITNEV